MSFLTVEWAINDAPVKDLTEWAILVAMAQRAREDGTAAFRGKPALARIARCDKKTVQRVQNRLRERGIIALGDQNLVAHIDHGRRPVVYDLLIPYAWFGEKIERINRERVESGYKPLTPEDRPPLAPAPEKAVRSDKGKPRPKRVPDGDDAGAAEEKPGESDGQGWGDSQSPLFEDPQEGEGGLSVPPAGTESPVTGDCESTPGGTESPVTGDCETPNSVVDSVVDSVLDSVTPPVVAAVGSPTARTARASAPAAQPGKIKPIHGRAVLAEIPRYRSAPGWAMSKHLVPMALRGLAVFGPAAIVRYGNSIAAEERFLPHQHIPEFRDVLRRLGLDVTLGTACRRDGLDPKRCPCTAEPSPGDRPWTQNDQASLERALDELGATDDERAAIEAERVGWGEQLQEAAG